MISSRLLVLVSGFGSSEHFGNPYSLWSATLSWLLVAFALAGMLVCPLHTYASEKLSGMRLCKDTCACDNPPISNFKTVLG